MPARIRSKNGKLGEHPGSRSDLWSRPGFLVRRLHQIHVALFIEECGEFNITPTQYGVMTALSETPGIDQVSVASEVGIDRTNVADILYRLEDRGIVKREPSPKDGRMKLAFLTARGEALTRKMETDMVRAQDRLVAPLPRADRAVLLDLLSRLVEANNSHSRAPMRMGRSRRPGKRRAGPA